MNEIDEWYRDRELTVRFVNPFYTSTVRNWVAVQFPTGERVELWEDGERLASVDDPGERWPELLYDQADGTRLVDIQNAHTQESYE